MSAPLVLHIDIDFFVDPVVYYRLDRGPRPSGKEYRAEEAASVAAFLKKQCLVKKKKLPGAAVVHNDEVFGALEEFIARGELKTPFEMIHIDAHADLGVGEHDYSFQRISTDLLQRPIEERAKKVREGFGALAFGNWLAFCLACRWIDKMTIVRHPRAADDLPQGYFVEYLQPAWQQRPPRRELNIRMQPLSRDEFETRAWQRTGRWGRKLEKPIEAPLIPATIIDREEFQLERTPDFLFVCQSPGYAPKTADKLFEAVAAKIGPTHNRRSAR